MEVTPGERLMILRLRAKLNISTAAKALGVARNTLSDVERGSRLPSGPLAAAIQRSYEIPAAIWFEPVSKSTPPSA